MRMGRPRKLTPTLQVAIVQAVENGVSLSAASELAGVNRFTVEEWLRRGLGQDDRPCTPLYANFASEILRARAVDEARRIARIEQAAQGGQVVYRRTVTDAKGREVVEERIAPPDWQADAWHLERSRPQDWGRKDRVDIKVQIQQLAAKIAEEMGVTADEVLAEAQALLAEAQ